MTEIITFQRNRCTTLETIDKNTQKAVCKITDTLTDAETSIIIALPDLEIIDVAGRVNRGYNLPVGDVSESLKPVIGTRVGAGMKKIILGLLGDSVGRQLSFMIEECCHAAILGFTKDSLVQVGRETASSREFFADMIKNNIRLYNRCAAFAPGSSLTEGIEPPQ